MILQSIARRYARALFEAVGADFERAGNELDVFARTMGESPELTSLLTAPGVERSTRERVLEAIITNASFHPMVGNLLRLLASRDRLSQVPGIARLFRDMVDEHAGRVRAQVTSATPMSADQLAQLEKALAGATNKKVELETREDPNLLGGLVAQIGSLVYDGSLRTQLEALRRELTERA